MIIGKKLAFILTEYDANKFAKKNDIFDLRKLPARLKNILLHDKSIINARLAICGECEHFIKTTSQCNQCGCFMRAKARLATSSCPVGKWNKEFDFLKGKEVGPIATN